MAQSHQSPPPETREFVTAIVACAICDAHAVCDFLDLLRELGEGEHARGRDRDPTEKEQFKRPVAVPHDFVYQLGAALRLCRWDGLGISVHREAGLPSGREALANVFRAAADPLAAPEVAQLPAQVFAILIEHF